MNAEAIRLHDEALRLMPEGASHDAQLCPICVDLASKESTSEIPPVPDRSGEQEAQTESALATEGGNTHQMDTMTQETHEALQNAAVEKATKDAAAQIEALQAEVSSLKEERDSAQAEAASLTEENERLNGELDTAQVQVKTLTDEKAALEADISKREEDAQLAEVAAARAQQVRNLGLFTEEHISEKAEKWAKVAEEDWAERLEEWKTVKGESPAPPSTNGSTERASAFTGSGESEEKSKVNPRRAVLGLS